MNPQADKSYALRSPHPRGSVMKRYLPATLRKSLALAAALLLAAGPGGGDVPKFITYQGRLIRNGVPANGTFNMFFRICDLSDCSNPPGIYREPSGLGTLPVVVSTGLFSVQIGNSNPIPDTVFDGPNAFIEVNVEGEVLLPRERIAAHPYALRASSASFLAAQENQFGVFATTHVVLLGSARLGIGFSNPSSPLYVAGQAEVDKLLITSGGSEGSPALANGPDNNTGVYWTGSDGLGIATSGATRLFATSGGNVGVGTTSPDERFHVNGIAKVSTLKALNGSASSPAIQADADADAGFYFTGAGGGIGVATSGSTRIFVEESGDVGIGTTVPGSLLHVNGAAQVGTGTSASPSLHFGSTDSGLFAPGNKQVGIATSGSTRVFVDSDGEVGIGTTAPTAKLDAAGTFKLGSNGAVITGLRKTSVSWAVPSTGSGACSDFASAMTSGSVVIGVVTTVTPAAGSFFGPGGCGSPSARDWSNPSFGNGGQEVWLHYRNNTGGSLDPDGIGTTGFDIYYLEP